MRHKRSEVDIEVQDRNYRRHQNDGKHEHKERRHEHGGEHHGERRHKHGDENRIHRERRHEHGGEHHREDHHEQGGEFRSHDAEYHEQNEKLHEYSGKRREFDKDPGEHGERRHERNGRKKEGHGGKGRFSIAGLLDGKPDAMILFVGALGCTRHRGFQMGDLMREGKMALLCPTATDFATGRYLHQIVDAMAELKEERGVSEFVLMYGCQTALLSTDFDLILQEAKENHGITVSVREVCHLCQSDAAKKEQEELTDHIERSDV